MTLDSPGEPTSVMIDSAFFTDTSIRFPTITSNHFEANLRHFIFQYLNIPVRVCKRQTLLLKVTIIASPLKFNDKIIP